jgi:hypothetical protein
MQCHWKHAKSWHANAQRRKACNLMTCNSALTDREFCCQVQLVQVHAQERALGWWIHVRDPILLQHLTQVWTVLLCSITWLTCSSSLRQPLVLYLCTFFPLLQSLCLSPSKNLFLKNLQFFYFPRFFLSCVHSSLICPWTCSWTCSNSTCSSFVQILSWNLNMFMNSSWTVCLVHEHVHQKKKPWETFEHVHEPFMNTW